MAHVVALLVLLLVAGCGDPTLPPGNPARPDVVLVSVDTLRADHLSCYGHSRETSPFIDSLAAGGVRFAHARSASPWTLPAHVTMMTGLLPNTHRVIEDSLVLEEGVPVLAESARDAGYETGAYVSTYYVSALFGFQRGFRRFEDFFIHDEKSNLKNEVLAEDVVDAALRWWSDLPDGAPVFLFLHVYDVHYHYDPPGNYATMFDRAPTRKDRTFTNYANHKKRPLGPKELEHQLAQYDESIRYVDDQLSRVGAALEAAGRTARWVVTADHGEEFGERGSWGHAHTLYAEQLRVPLVMSGGGLPSGEVIEEAVGLQDIAPTVAPWFGGAKMKNVDGEDLGSRIAGKSGTARPFLAETTRFDSNRLSLYEDGLRIEWDLAGGRTELFDAAGDRNETTDLATGRPDDVRRLQQSALRLLGVPWGAGHAGTVVTDGVLLRPDGGRSLHVRPWDGFVVLPWDAEVRFRPDAPYDTAILIDAAGRMSRPELGPWRAAGGPLPKEGDPLLFKARSPGARPVELAPETRENLEALGYVQGK